MGGVANILVGEKPYAGIISAFETFSGKKAMEESQKQARALMSEQERRNAALESEARRRAEEEQGQEASLRARQAAKARQRSLAAQVGGSDTILTGPLGLTGAAPTAQKTLLGT